MTFMILVPLRKLKPPKSLVSTHSSTKLSVGKAAMHFVNNLNVRKMRSLAFAAQLHQHLPCGIPNPSARAYQRYLASRTGSRGHALPEDIHARSVAGQTCYGAGGLRRYRLENEEARASASSVEDAPGMCSRKLDFPLGRRKVGQASLTATATATTATISALTQP
jgi:hypothetical protein